MTQRDGQCYIYIAGAYDRKRALSSPEIGQESLVTLSATCLSWERDTHVLLDDRVGDTDL